MVGGCGRGNDPPLVGVGGMPGMPLKPGSKGKGSLSPGLSPSIVPAPSSFIGADNRRCFTLQIRFHFAIKYLQTVTRPLH